MEEWHYINSDGSITVRDEDGKVKILRWNFPPDNPITIIPDVEVDTSSELYVSQNSNE